MSKTTQATHTPGPWVADGTKIEGANRGHMHDIAWAAMPIGLKPREESLANARLIAAAPELLAACDVALRYVGALVTCPLCGISPRHDVNGHDSSCPMRELTAAIAKAKERAL